MTKSPPWYRKGIEPLEVLDIISKTEQPPAFPESISTECRSFLTACL
jgi:hypothetical protein